MCTFCIRGKWVRTKSEVNSGGNGNCSVCVFDVRYHFERSMPLKGEKAKRQKATGNTSGKIEQKRWVAHEHKQLVSLKHKYYDSMMTDCIVRCSYARHRYLPIRRDHSLALLDEKEVQRFDLSLTPFVRWFTPLCYGYGPCMSYWNQWYLWESGVLWSMSCLLVHCDSSENTTVRTQKCYVSWPPNVSIWWIDGQQ